MKKNSSFRRPKKILVRSLNEILDCKVLSSLGQEGIANADPNIYLHSWVSLHDSQ